MSHRIYTVEEALNYLVENQLKQITWQNVLSGQVRAFELILQALAQSHPAPLQLKARWKMPLVGVSDFIRTMEPQNTEAAQQSADAAQQLLGRFSAVVESLECGRMN